MPLSSEKLNEMLVELKTQYDREHPIKSTIAMWGMALDQNSREIHDLVKKSQELIINEQKFKEAENKHDEAQKLYLAGSNALEILQEKCNAKLREFNNIKSMFQNSVTPPEQDSDEYNEYKKIFGENFEDSEDESEDREDKSEVIPLEVDPDDIPTIEFYKIKAMHAKQEIAEMQKQIIADRVEVKKADLKVKELEKKFFVINALIVKLEDMFSKKAKEYAPNSMNPIPAFIAILNDKSKESSDHFFYRGIGLILQAHYDREPGNPYHNLMEQPITIHTPTEAKGP